jgi:cystathionine beta-lyase
MSRFDSLDLARLERRRGVKWSWRADGAIPMWVADMDFPPPDVVTAALATEIESGDLGYPDLRTPRLEEAFRERMRVRHGWDPAPGRTRELCDIIQGLQIVLHLTCAPGDGVAFHTPCYPPFLQTFRQMGIEPRPIPLRRVDDGWAFDPDEASRAIRASRVLLVVNPHNPTGRSLRRPELEMLVALATEHDVPIVSDEVHADLTYPPSVHVPTASVGGAADRTITLTSATKAFNLAGIRCAIAHGGPDELLDRLDALPGHLFGAVSNLGATATLAAWESGDSWLSDLLIHLDGNRRRLAERLASEAPAVDHAVPEATYLAWIDVRRSGLGPHPAAGLEEAAGVKLSPGEDFGSPGWVRLNFATARPILDEALDRLVPHLGPGRPGT